jgi:hypothetical protein
MAENTEVVPHTVGQLIKQLERLGPDAKNWPLYHASDPEGNEISLLYGP